jgi:hypothetical protein
MPSGSAKTENGEASADFTIPLSGPKGSGHVHYKGATSDGKWATEEFDVTIDGSGKVIDLNK